MIIDLRNAQNYEDSLNNILHKAPLEAGVERVVITLLNDILSDLGRWPELSAEDTPTLKKKFLNNNYGIMALSVPDGIILDDSVKARSSNGHIRPLVLIEVKDLSINPDEDVFTAPGAKDLIQKLKNKSDIENIIKYFFKCNLPLPIKNGWTLKQLLKNKVDKAYTLEIRNSLGALVATLHQLDTYLLDCYLYREIEGVIWTNGLCWKIWTKDASGNINNINSNPGFKLDKNGYEYIPNGYTGNIQIDQNEFNALIYYLKYILSTL